MTHVHWVLSLWLPFPDVEKQSQFDLLRAQHANISTQFSIISKCHFNIPCQITVGGIVHGAIKRNRVQQWATF